MGGAGMGGGPPGGRVRQVPGADTAYGSGRARALLSVPFCSARILARPAPGRLPDPFCSARSPGLQPGPRPGCSFCSARWRAIPLDAHLCVRGLLC